MRDYLYTYKGSGSPGWVVYYDTEESVRNAAGGLAAAGIPTEMRHSEKGAHPYWLVVGIFSNGVDEIISPLLESGQFQPGPAAEFLQYRDVTADSAPLMSAEERRRHDEKLKRDREKEIRREEEAKRSTEAELLEELRRNKIKAERECAKVCIMCGNPLGFSQKLFSKKTHKNCTLFTEERSYVDNGDGTVTDLATGLMWTKKAVYGRMKWSEAVQYCNKIKLAGYNDWRLPTIDRHGGKAELDTLFRKGGSPFGEWEGAGGTPFTGVQSGGYWSSTPFAHDADFAWYVDMGNGGAYFYNKTYYGYVWPVRGEKQENFILDDLTGSGQE